MKANLLTKKILKGFLIAGYLYIAASSPYFSLHLVENIKKELKKRSFFQEKKNSSRFNNTFYYLKKRGYLNIQKNNKQIYISLTKEGKERAGKYFIDDLKIEKPKKWDKKWRIVIFDIPSLTNIKRIAFRIKLKEMGFYMLQQSVWVYPYDCRKEIKLLREFYGLNQKELKLIIGVIEEDSVARKRFKL